MKFTWLAWAGWKMRIPEDWRPLKIEDAPRRENMMVGTGEKPFFQIKWCRVGIGENFNFDSWLRQRLKKMALENKPEPGGPNPEGFNRTAWFPEAVNKKGIERTLWYGYSRGGGIILEVAISLSAEKRIQKIIEKNVLSSAGVSPSGEETKWCVFDVGFSSPGGFRLMSKKLHVGDMTLELERGKEKLVLRQVYPAELALDRRKLEGWLKLISSGAEIRKRSFESDPAECTVVSFGQTMKGLKTEGRRMFRKPFHSLGARRFVSSVTVDDRLGRLLMAEYDFPANKGKDQTEQCIGKMNWQKFEV